MINLAFTKVRAPMVVIKSSYKKYNSILSTRMFSSILTSHRWLEDQPVPENVVELPTSHKWLTTQ